MVSPVKYKDGRGRMSHHGALTCPLALAVPMRVPVDTLTLLGWLLEPQHSDGLERISDFDGPLPHFSITDAHRGETALPPFTGAGTGV